MGNQEPIQVDEDSSSASGGALPPPTLSKQKNNATFHPTHQNHNNKSFLYSTLGPYDVLLGRGTGPNEHPGNIRYRELVRDHLQVALDKLSSTPPTKTPPKTTKMTRSLIVFKDVAQDVVEAVHNHGGRFLVQYHNPAMTSTNFSSLVSASSSSSPSTSPSPPMVVVDDLVSPCCWFQEVSVKAAVAKALQAVRHQAKMTGPSLRLPSNNNTNSTINHNNKTQEGRKPIKDSSVVPLANSAGDPSSSSSSASSSASSSSSSSSSSLSSSPLPSTAAATNPTVPPSVVATTTPNAFVPILPGGGATTLTPMFPAMMNPFMMGMTTGIPPPHLTSSTTTRTIPTTTPLVGPGARTNEEGDVSKDPRLQPPPSAHRLLDGPSYDMSLPLLLDTLTRGTMASALGSSSSLSSSSLLPPWLLAGTTAVASPHSAAAVGPMIAAAASAAATMSQSAEGTEDRFLSAMQTLLGATTLVGGTRDGGGGHHPYSYPPLPVDLDAAASLSSLSGGSPPSSLASPSSTLNPLLWDRLMALSRITGGPSLTTLAATASQTPWSHLLRNAPIDAAATTAAAVAAIVDRQIVSPPTTTNTASPPESTTTATTATTNVSAQTTTASPNGEIPREQNNNHINDEDPSYSSVVSLLVLAMERSKQEQKTLLLAETLLLLEERRRRQRHLQQQQQQQQHGKIG